MNIVLARLKPQFIKMPSDTNYISDFQNKFYMKAKCPRCIGTIDYLHIKISSPSGNEAEKTFFL